MNLIYCKQTVATPRGELKSVRERQHAVPTEMLPMIVSDSGCLL